MKPGMQDWSTVVFLISHVYLANVVSHVRPEGRECNQWLGIDQSPTVDVIAAVAEATKGAALEPECLCVFKI
jgi:hypothetical protein